MPVGLFEESLAERREPLRLMAAGRALDERASARPLELGELAQERVDLPGGDARGVSSRQTGGGDPLDRR